MGTDYPSIRISKEMAEQIAQSLYGLEGEFIPLPGDRDFNFRLDTGTGKYVLKISRPDHDETGINFQKEILQYLSGRGGEIVIPEIFPDIQGNPISEWTDDSGQSRKVRMLSWIEGRVWSDVNPITDSLFFSLGLTAGKLSSTLQDFDTPAARRNFDWDIARAEWTTGHLHLFTPARQEILIRFQDQFLAFQNAYQQLRKGVVQNDANDNNVIVSMDLLDPEVIAIIDFGDALYTQVINDLAIAIAYAIMGQADVMSAAVPVVKGYHSQFPLQEAELEFLYTLVAMRLVISVTKSAIARQAEPDNAYLLISEKPAWEVLEKWDRISKKFALFNFRNACNYTAHPHEYSFQEWAGSCPARLSSLFPTLGKEKIHHLDLSVSSTWPGHQLEFEDLELFQFKLNRLQTTVPEFIIAGGYLEPRTAYTTSAYDKDGNQGVESRTVHLGIDFWVPCGTPVHAIFNGTIVTAVNDAGDKEYGGLVVLKHQLDDIQFYTLHGHLTPESVGKLEVGQVLKKEDRIGFIGNFPENGNWAPHLHFQFMLDTLGYINDFPGVAFHRELDVWKSICPDPNLVFAQPGLQVRPTENIEDTIKFRKEHLGKSLSLSYTQPLNMVRGSGIYLFDHTGRKFLDTVNNVAHVGHEHPRVVAAGQQQMAVLNTNTRYLNDQINAFAEELLSTFPEELSVVHLVNSGSEANELALRMARVYTGQKDLIAMEIGYHGNTSGCIDVSSYKFDGKGGSGAPEHTHIIPLPDSYRGIYRGEDTGAKYAGHVRESIEHIHSRGRKLAGFICESIISCGGQVELPDQFLQLAYESVRAGGGVCIADEVQVGCGRVGSTFWGFQLHGVIPDIVTIGKPIGNGHPLAAVVCTREVADAFANGMEYFNTFGGNPVSCAIGLEVMRVVREEGLQENALSTGNYLKSQLISMQEDFPILGDIRGQGLFLGIELADEMKNPLTEKAAYLVNRMKELGILMSTDGKDNNVLKIKPPIVFFKTNADELLSGLIRVLNEDFMKL